ncbi:MAG TPA: MYXO-CTERM sorting domain-containing protein [Polyangia bacterium]|nr:MYXO-CTERM sorting domain-containing protein [Polyangia bacterium]
MAASCSQPKVEPSIASTPAALTAAATGTGPGDLDVLFMIDNSSSMTEMQQKLSTQLPGFLTALQNLPAGLPNIHIAVVSSDLGAPGDVTSSIGCTQDGDQGIFRTGSMNGGSAEQHPGLDGGAPGGAAGGDDASAPSCAGASLSSGATFVSNVDGVANYTGDLSSLLSCMTALGDSGCGFEHQLASISRALGADGSPAPAQNAGFLRPDAQLAIIVLSNEDDCSAPATTDLYSLNGGEQNISNLLGPIANYRCNQFGHLCVDPAAAGSTTCLAAPPLQPPFDAQGTNLAPTLNLTDCESNDSLDSKLTSIVGLVKGIKALKADPSNQIVVGAIVAPPTPYTVAWVPETAGQNTLPGELWPQIEHSCGAAGGDDVNPAGQTTTDDSFGDPAVRIAQWVQAFGPNGVTASICDGSYANAFGAIVSKIGAHLPGGSGTVTDTVDASTGSSALPICPNGISPGPSSGLSDGGCACGAAPARASLWTLALLGILLAFARRRRRASRR